MKIGKVIYEGRTLPRGYGVAYREYDRLVAVAYPIPLNVIISYVRKLWLKLKTSESLLKDVKTEAYRMGHYEGYELGKKTAEDKVVEWAKDYFKAMNKNIKKHYPKVRTIKF